MQDVEDKILPGNLPDKPHKAANNPPLFLHAQWSGLHYRLRSLLLVTEKQQTNEMIEHTVCYAKTML